MRQVTSSPWRDRFEAYAPNGKYLAYISDESLEEEIWLYAIETGARKKLTSLASTKSGFVWSRDSKQIAFSADQKLYLADAEPGTVRELAEQPGGYAISEFSPDGKWLVLSYRDDDANADVYLFNIAEKKLANMTNEPVPRRERDSDPGRQVPGLRLEPRSRRRTRLFKVALARLTEDPDDPLVKERLKREEEARGRARPGEGSRGRPRPRRRPGRRRAAGRRRSPRGRTRSATSSSRGTARRSISRARTTRGRDCSRSGSTARTGRRSRTGRSAALSPTEDRKFLFYRAQNSVYKMELAPNRDKKKIGFAFKVTVDRRKEFEQIFEECWRVMKYRFYDPKMHGTDWEAVRRTYKPLLKYAGRLPRRLRHLQRDDRRAQRLAHRRQRPSGHRAADDLPDRAPSASK